MLTLFAFLNLGFTQLGVIVMKLCKIQIHNFRSIVDAEIEVHGYTMIVGANNAGKSNALTALRAFYDDIKWTNDDLPKVGKSSDESWVQLHFFP